jgi:hypothetical protein
MKLFNAAGSALTLTIVGYQFPRETPERYDANWLMVRVSAARAGRAWTFTDPCLLTWEVASLAQWLTEVQSGRSPQPADCSFTEPLLRFQLAAAPNGQPTLRVLFELEGRPPWAYSDSFGGEDVVLDFPLAGIDLHAASASLRAQLQRYPVRN